MFDDRPLAEHPLEPVLSALEDRQLARQLITANPQLYASRALAERTPRLPCEEPSSPTEPLALAVVIIVVVFCLAGITASIYGIAMRELAHTALQGLLSLARA